MIFEEDHLSHYGILRRSGRYPYGSSGNEDTDANGFLDFVNDLRRQGLKETEIAKGLGMSTTQLRAVKSIAKNEKKQSDIAQVERLKAKGMSNVAIGERMGMPESSVRALLAPGVKDKADVLASVSTMLKRQVDDKGLIDVGVGVEHYVGVSRERLNTALAVLKEEGYEVHGVKIRQLGTGLETDMKILAPPGTTQRDVFLNRDDIRLIQEFSDDGGRSFGKTHDPIPVDPKRVHINYKEDGGDQADGVIYVRPGTEDLSLGGKNYAQVRIQVGDEHYLKGMAIYKDNLPPGVDLLFNTNKSNTGDKFDAMKPVKRTLDGSIDPDLPFGSIVRQIIADPGTENERVTSAINLVNEEGQWNEWARTLSSQMLSKQQPKLARQQLELTYENRRRELDEIMALTNPTIKKKLLETFADSTDSAAVHLKAAKMPRQASQVILPIGSIKPTEIYAPNYNDGERVVLIRYPHGGTFEIPELTVNNKQREAKRLLGDAEDAVGIHHSVAEWLSGADFDGDTVLVIPNNSGKIKTTPPLEKLKGFDPRASYPAYEGMKPISPKRMQQEMGSISNLITDMTIKGAPHEEIVRAVKHSMVVIDSEKHKLNYKESAKANGIRALKEEYQGKPRGGASTLISRAGREVRVPDFKPRPQKDGGPVDKTTGARVNVPTGKYRTDVAGNRVEKLVKTKELAITDDAHTLSSGTPMEKLYGDHSNRLKSLANEARLRALNTPPMKRSPSAAKAYAKEVTSLNSKLTLAKRNAPLERQAQVIANAAVKKRKKANPDIEEATKKKIEAQELEKARARTGAKKHKVKITDEEWHAIQAGAISNHKLTQILADADLDVVRAHATPRRELLMTDAKASRARDMFASGYTRAEVASQLGVSLTTLDTAVKGSG